jgi:hypothetical protein
MDRNKNISHVIRRLLKEDFRLGNVGFHKFVIGSSGRRDTFYDL